MDVGFIGLGAMGSAMASNLAAAGHQVGAWNRSGRQVEGVGIVATPADAFAADVVFTMLSDEAAIQEVVLDGDILTGVKAGAVHMVCSTISVAFAQRLVEAHDAADVAFVSAPVLG